MKAKIFHKIEKNKRWISVLLIVALIFSMFPQLAFWEDTEVSAAGITTTTIKARFDEKMEALGWVDSENMLVTGVNKAMWQPTNGQTVYRINSEGIMKEKPSAAAIGYLIVPEEGNTAADYLYPENTNPEETLPDDSTASSGNADASDSGAGSDNPDTGTADGSTQFSEYAFSGASNVDSNSVYIPNNQEDSELYYTIEFDEALNGYYRQYYVSTADQLATLFYHYKADFSSSLKLVSNEAGSGKASVNKLGIVLLNDIDLGGGNGIHWKAYNNSSVYLEIDGQGYTIYNGYMTENSEFFLGGITSGSYEQKVSIHDLTFSNMYMGRRGGMFGLIFYGYFRNVNWTHCLAAGETEVISGNSIVFAQSYLYVFLKDCTIDDSYVAGYAHCALFASYNSSISYSANRSYIGDTTLEDYIGDSDTRASGSKTTQGFYYISVPDSVEDAERAMGGLSVTAEDGKTYWLATSYPSIYENCATVNSAVYDSGANHSGTFVACFQGSIIFKNCFSNSTIYANQQLGVFAGAAIGCSDGFYYPDNGEKTFVNSYFDECYTSGSIEGNNRIGGFIGMVFNDNRAYDFLYRGTSSSNGITTYTVTAPDNTHRGKVVFNNCYSTSSVGMQYADSYVGGFAGLVYGNSPAANEEDVRHVFRNCYAAGEVGGITTGTDTDDTNHIGGFFGSYRNYAYGDTKTIDASFQDLENNYLPNLEAGTYTYDENNHKVVYSSSNTATTAKLNEWYSKWCLKSTDDVSITEKNNLAEIINCYYDMQTTAMRERDIGNNESNKNLCGTLSESSIEGIVTELKGVYTKASETKEVAGLTDTVDMGNAAVWDSSMTDYYPQLRAFFDDSLPENYSQLSAAAQAMYDRRAEIYKNCALASTATVLLDHYDQLLNESGKLEEADATVYDTVRDITRKFEFTTDSGSGIAWECNADRNKENNYISTIDSAGQGFSVSYETVGDDGNTQTAEKVHNPEVLKIVLDTTVGEQYKCTEFAPGRQWVTVSAGSGDTEGSRDLRLLPTAYLNAGGTMEVNVVVSDDSITNTVTLDGNVLPSFNHSAGVAYALTDKNRMGTIVENQTVNRYSDPTDTASFALYSGYLISGDSTAVGPDETGKMYEQKFTNTKYDNNSSEGMTMVRVFKTERNIISAGTGSEGSIYLLERGEEITDPDELEKWSGDALFTTADVGYYYMEYYWRLDDGRYLTDDKLVKVKSSSHTVEIVTGLLNEENTVSVLGDGTFSAATDQYVTDSITQEEGVADTWEKNYVLQSEDFAVNNPGASYDGTFSYNYAKYFGDELYFLKSKQIVSSTANSVVGWSRTSDYRLTTLIVEAQTPDGEWVEMARVDENSPTFDFSNAQYQYQFSGYTVEQNPETKLFTVTEKDSVNREFKVENSLAGSGVENFIEFAFTTSEDVDISYDSSDSIRVTALFRKNYADVQTVKQVLLNPASELNESVRTVSAVSDGETVTSTETVYDSLEQADKEYEVDDTGIVEDDERKAVLSGDVLTYRVKLYNAGFYDSGETNVYDTVPEGCSYVEGSVKIYRQNKDVSSGSPFYGELENVTEAEGYEAVYDETSGELQWHIPTVELEYDYYVEYQVRVEQLAAERQSRLLTNTATWDYIMLNGDLELEDDQVVDTITSIEHYQQNAIFTMNASVEESEADGMYYAKYEITFQQNPNSKAEYRDIIFTDYLPEGFEFREGSVIELIRIGQDGTEQEKETYSVSGSDSIINTALNSFTIENFSFDAENTYLVRFTGSYIAPTTDMPEVVNKAEISYNKVTNDEDGNEETQGKANSITKVFRLSNQVETDVVHLYLEAEKTIEVNDPSQTFLFRINRYESEAAYTAGEEPEETFYTQIRCTEAQSDGTYQGGRLIQVDRRGYYTVTEITDWSAADYDFSEAYGTDASVTEASRNGRLTVSKNTVGFALPRRAYSSGAFPTAFGSLSEGTYPTAGFADQESVYAYRSGQAYAENKFVTGN